MVLGLRGIPGVQGGVETHVEHLYERLAKLGCDVEVIVRTPFVPAGRFMAGRVRLRRIWSPRTAGLEALSHSVLGVVYACLARPDILHLHAVGPSIVAPIARLLGLKVVVTHHGPDYDRDKWGGFARWVLRTGESLGLRYAHARIAISKVIVELIQAKYGLSANLIPNGVDTVTLQRGTEHLRQFGLEPGRYVLQVSRLVPEKRQLDLIAAFKIARIEGWKLALVGGIDDSPYCAQLKAAADSTAIVLTNFQTSVALAQLYSHAGLFTLPSSHEGLPIAMLEAMGYGLSVVASDIPANLEVGLPSNHYFPLGDVNALADRLKVLSSTPLSVEQRAKIRSEVACRYDWDAIAKQTLLLYQRVMDF